MLIFLKKSCVQAIWIAYEALRMVFSCHQDLKTADLQVMYWRDIKFWIKQEQDYVVFLTPDEYRNISFNLKWVKTKSQSHVIMKSIPGITA